MATWDLPKLFGYDATYLPFGAEEAGLEAETAQIVAAVKNEICAGRPAMVWNAFTALEWDVVAGFDDAAHQFFGRGSYAGMDDYAVAAQVRLIADRPALGAVLIGEKIGTFNAHAAEVAALEEAVRHAHTHKEYPAPTEGQACANACATDSPTPSVEWVFLEGVQCYNRWVEDLAADPKSASSLGSRYCYGIYRSTHRAAAGFLQELTAKYPGARKALGRAADAFIAEANALDACHDTLSWWAPDVLSPEAAAQAHELLGRARDAYARGIDEVAEALTYLT
jgi:hypothetical protein